jgi:WD40 repeat protein/beta-lactamase regulating signal transducer with metallopeptidase domain
VALVHVTLVALLGLLAWLVGQRRGPALRGAVLMAALIGLLVVPGLAVVAPVWLPLPDVICPVGGVAATDRDAGAPAYQAADPAVFAIVVPQPPAKGQLEPEDPAASDAGPTGPPAETEAVLIKFSVPLEQAASAARPAEPARPSWPLAGLLAAAWLLGALACLTRAFVRLALLYRCAWQARPVHAEDGTGGTPGVAVRESPRVTSPVTLGLFWPVILLPLGWRDWPAPQRACILAHELAHVRRRDFLAGLIAELAACLCWFHPLVRWLVGRLRLEQEFAADASVASSSADSMDYVRCLARLALAQGQGRGSLAPALWRRRPEILRRIDMLRRNPNGLPSRLGHRAAWSIALLTAVACFVVAGVGPLQSANTKATAETGPETKGRPSADPHGDLLPSGALARLGTTRWRHGAEVTFVSFTPDGKALLTAGQDNTIRLWDLASGKEIRRFARPAAIAPRIPRKADKAGANEKADTVIRMMAGGRASAGGFAVALAPDGKVLAAAGGGIVQLWEVETGKELRRIDAAGNGLAGLLFSPDGRTLAGRASDGTLVLWAADTGKEVRQFKPAPRQRGNGVVLVLGGGGNSIAPGMAFTPDSKALAAAVTDYKGEAVLHSVKLWDLDSGKELQQIKVPGDAGASVVAVAPGGKLLAYGRGGTVHLCEAASGKEVRQLKAPDRGVVALVFSPDGKTLAARSRNQRVRLWETDSGKELRQFGDAGTVQQTGGLAFLPAPSGPEARALAISPDGKQIAAAAGSTVRLWEAATGKELPLIDGHRQAPLVIIPSPDGKTVVSWGADRVVRRWEAATGKALGAFVAPEGTTVAAFSADGRTVALANADNSIRLHDTATRRELHRLKAHEGGIAALAFSPDAKMLASRGSSDGAIRLYEVAKGAELRQIALRQEGNQGGGGGGGAVLFLGGPARPSRGTGPGLAFSPDGRLLVATGPGNGALSNTLVLFDVASGKELRRIESPQGVASFAFSPDGRDLAAENADRTITLWEVASGKERGRLGKPAAERPQPNTGGMAFRVVIAGIDGGSFSDPGGPVGLTFSPDGRALVARGPDLAVRIWDVAAGKEVGQLTGHGGRVETVAFAPDGKTLASGSADTTVLLWDAAGPMKNLSQPQTADLPAAEADAVWGALAGEDAAKALRGVRKLAGAPQQAVPFLSERLKPVARVDPQKVAGWIAGLENDKFAVRQEAAASLLKVGEQAVPALRQVLTSSPQLETRKRVEELLDKLTGGILSAEQLRLVRAVEALERMGTPQARSLLRTLAAGAPGTLPTREAQAALKRMKDEG